MRAGPAFVLSFLGALIACDSPEAPWNGDVRVETPDGAPIGGATLDGGVDWNRWTVRTGPDGMAEPPDHAFGAPATIRATSRYGREVRELERGAYVLAPTPLRLDSVGRVWGRLVRGGAGGLSTIDHEGVWRHYSYGEAVSLRTERPLPGGRRPIGHTVVDDTLWVVSEEPGPSPPQDTAVEAFDIGDPTSPVRLGGFTAAGARWVLRRDSLLVLGDHNHEVARVLVAAVDGTRRELSTIRTDATAGFLFGDVLVLTRVGWPLRLVFIDLRDPAEPTVIERLSREDWGSAVVYGDSLLIEPRGHHIGGTDGEPVTHTLLDLSDPRNPRIAGERTADAYLWATFGDGWAAGDWSRDGWTLALLRREGEHFGLAATVAESTGRFRPAWALIDPPHFAVEGWMLRER